MPQIISSRKTRKLRDRRRTCPFGALKIGQAFRYKGATWLKSADGAAYSNEPENTEALRLAAGRGIHLEK